jgi:hypothetical protein
MLKNYGIASGQTGAISKPGSITDLSGLDIVGEPDEQDRRSLAEVEAMLATDRFIQSTSETQELAHQQHELNTEAVKQFRWHKQEELAREGDRIGRIISQEELLNGLNQIVPARYNLWSKRGMVGLSVLKDGNWKYACAVQCGYMPEYSVMRFDTYGLPLNEKYRGWRTVLLRLIVQDLISETRAHEIFGAPPENRASRRYWEQLFNYRNRKGE